MADLRHDLWEVPGGSTRDRPRFRSDPVPGLGILGTEPVIGPGRVPHLICKIKMVAVSERIGYNHGRRNQEWAFMVDKLNFGGTNIERGRRR